MSIVLAENKRGDKFIRGYWGVTGWVILDFKTGILSTFIALSWIL